ncbi:pyridoxamine 5'-phosphate oxidase family protein [Croceibacterium sp. LX-88]|uniref:Pyridoxamine 5'-phosphate oxidase family protein n=1 Tax=Croceibacterium selenioxidans TaxID=2838833 RepID=A0ABS5W8C0_9SPHN|nr:pyridoxamine 5'-phosphate oxidase family protein [Croceibacterium selenioxidans]MBT2134634.1 pyridoxamine 5'-phosphate oxidase family protein [Croceibacterium selenioxidans]
MVSANDELDLKRDFWNALEESQTLMLGLVGDSTKMLRPMTAQIDRSPLDESDSSAEIYFFASRGEGVGASLLQGGSGSDAIAAFQSKGHEILASIRGSLSVVEERATVDRLWSPFAELYYEEGKADPNLLLLRLDSATAEIWRADATGFFKSIAFKLLGKDPGRANPEDRGAISI